MKAYGQMTPVIMFRLVMAQKTLHHHSLLYIPSFTFQEILPPSLHPTVLDYSLLLNVHMAFGSAMCVHRPYPPHEMLCSTFFSRKIHSLIYTRDIPSQGKPSQISLGSYFAPSVLPEF